MGAPSKYRPEMLEQILELMAQGMSQAEVAREIGISKRTWLNWKEKNPDFADAVDEGTWRSLGWWERQGRSNLSAGKEFNHILWMMNVKNRFPAEWREKQDVAHTLEVSLVDLVAKSMEVKEKKEDKDGDK
jgi:transcriptional regulator with XRE-family HTH domain